MIERICEFLAYWLGGTHLQELAPIARLQPRRLRTVLKDEFLRRGRVTVRYDRNAKRFVAASPLETKELLGLRTADEVVTTLLAVRAWSRDDTPPFPCPAVSTRQYRRQPDPDVFRLLLAGCTRQRPVHLTYRARTREFTTTFSPHTLVQTAQREHFRGYSVFETGEGHYWDLVPSRVIRAELGHANDYVDEAGDQEWTQQSLLRLALSRRLPLEMRNALREEHGMTGDVLEIGPLPQALLHYVSAEYTHRHYQGYTGKVWRQLESSGR